MNEGFVGSSGYYYKIRAVVKGQVPDGFRIEKEKFAEEAVKSVEEKKTDEEKKSEITTHCDKSKIFKNNELDFSFEYFKVVSASVASVYSDISKGN